MPKEVKLESLPGVGPVTAKKLHAHGIKSVEQLALYASHELVDLGIFEDEIQARRVTRAAKAAVGRLKLRLASETKEELARAQRLTTGVKAIDELLKTGSPSRQGGLEPGAIYEFAGEFGSGKTQFCHQLAVSIQLQGGRCFYVDTEGTFSPARIEAIAERFGIDDALNKIYHSQPQDVDELEDVLQRDAQRLVLFEGVRLIVVDSFIALYRSEFKHRERLAARQQRMNYVLDLLKRAIRAKPNCYGVITNQVVIAPTGVNVKPVPTGGNIIAHASTHRLFLVKPSGKDQPWWLTVLDSPHMPYGAKAPFVITDKGVEDWRG